MNTVGQDESLVPPVDLLFSAALVIVFQRVSLSRHHPHSLCTDPTLRVGADQPFPLHAKTIQNTHSTPKCELATYQIAQTQTPRPLLRT